MLNSSAINDHTLNGGFAATGVGQISTQEQKVVVKGEGNITSFEQSTSLLITGTGLIVSFEQQMLPTASGALFTIEQRIRTLAANTFFSRNGYDVDIFIAGYAIPKTQIHGDLIIQRAEGSATSASFTLIPSAGVQNPELYQGKPVYINAITSAGVFRLFTGYCDLPHIDLVEKKISFDCTDRRAAQLNNASSATITSIGYYSNAVFGLPKDQNDELEKRLSTVPYSYDFDTYGTGILTAWAPKAIADYTLSGSDIYYDTPRVDYTNRAQTLNSIQITVNYTFQRLHQQICTVSWSGYQDFCRDYFNAGRPSFPTRDMVESAANSLDWKVVGNVSYTSLWPAGGFSCSGIPGESVGASAPISWQPDQIQYEYAQRTSREYVTSGGALLAGSPTIDRPVYDASGNAIYDVSRVITTNTSAGLCRGASWTAGRKFAQNVVQTYTMTVNSPQAIARFGTISTKERTDIIDTYDSSRWERDPTIYSTAVNFYSDQKTNSADLSNALFTAYQKARTTLLQAHRDVTVTFKRGLWPQIDLKHTVETTATAIACKGKVSAITHRITVGTGEAVTEVSLRLSRSYGGDSDTGFYISTPTDSSSYIGTPVTVNLGTHIGLDINTTSGASIWNGYVGNKTLFDGRTGYSRTTYTEAFIVDYPAIANTIRDNRSVSSSVTYNVSIPNDSLTVTF